MGRDKSASNSALILACRHSYRDDVELPEEVPGEAAERGSRIHGAIENGTELDDFDEQGCVEAARKWIRDNVTADDATQTEPAYAWNGKDQATYLGVGRKSYDLAPEDTVFKGTADLLVVLANGTRVVVDWKSSERSAAHAREQLMTLATIVRADRIVSVELRTDGTYREHINEDLMPWDLDAHAELMLEAARNIVDAPTQYGDHCTERYCPLRGRCAEFKDAADESAIALVPAAALVRRRMTDAITTAEDVADTIEFLSKLEEWVKAKKNDLHAFVDGAGGEVRISDTYVYRSVESSRAGVRGKEAIALAEKLGADQEDLAKLTYTTKFTSYRKVRKNT